MDVDAFIERWTNAPKSERSESHSFLIQLCRVIGVVAPNDETVGDPDYRFERIVRFHHDDDSSHWGFIDLYRRGSFVLEAKQTKKRLAAQPDLNQMKLKGPEAVERKMETARVQAKGYARALDEWPPFLIALDVGEFIELWSDFSRMGKTYLHYPDRENYRIALSDLKDPKIRERLAAVWTNPMSLDPARRVTEATTEIATILGQLVQSFRTRLSPAAKGDIDNVHRALWEKRVAVFVMQCVFAMFADSVELIPDRAFSQFLRSYSGDAKNLHKAISQVFRTMNTGGHCPVLRCDLRWFNGGLYAEDAAIAVSDGELEILCRVADCDWGRVEPAIFGALMENALSSEERSQLGAHYTPKAMVETLVQATIMDVLQKEWEAAAVQADTFEKGGELQKAQELVTSFHRALCHVKVLDPACGTGNFLYVAMDRIKDLEGEVIERLVALGVSQRLLEMDGWSVGPGQFMGVEKSTQAVWIATVVMWIGLLQWHYRLWGRLHPSDPVLKDYCAVERGDAILEWRGTAAAPATPDGVRYLEPYAPKWPEAHFIIGNPPFIAGKDLRTELGSAYANALWASRGGQFKSADIVAVWWDRAAEILAADASKAGPFDQILRRSNKQSLPKPALQRFGFVTTNSITQTFSRRVIEQHLIGEPPLRLIFAIPDHPWIKGAGAAAVRIAMSVVEAGLSDGRGRLLQIATEDEDRIVYEETIGDIGSDLTIGRRIERTSPLKANRSLAHRGVQLMGAGFLVSPDKAKALAKLSIEGQEAPVRQFRNGKDLTDRSRELHVIDFFGWSEGDARRLHPGFTQHLMETVKPHRDVNNRPSYRDNWWIFGEPRRELREALTGLDRYIVTVETSKHRWFRFLEASVMPDNRLVCVASDDPFVLGVLSSRAHKAWALAVGGRLEDRPVYSKGLCFDRFPFPQANSLVREEIATVAQGMDDLRAHVLLRNHGMAMTKLYNVMDKVAAGAALNTDERSVRQAGCVDLLLNSQQRLDRLVLEAYGWPSDIDEAGIVSRLVSLNQMRGLEERGGQIRFLRPEFQKRRLRKGAPSAPNGRSDRPTRLPNLPSDDVGRIMSVLEVLRSVGRPLKPEQLKSYFEISKRARGVEKTLQHTLDVLTAAGSIHRTDVGWFAPRRMPS